MRGGRFQDALFAFENVYAPFEDRAEKRTATVEFTLAVELRRAASLMALQRFAEARAIFESDAVQQLWPRVPVAQKCDYHLGYGELLCALGEADQAFDELQEAQRLAAIVRQSNPASPMAHA
jgi:tetratricopeptide (TPR) repeat protein